MQGIYAIVNNVTGERYIGKSVRIEDRWSVHRTHLRNNDHHCYQLQQAWNRYGEWLFSFIILELVEDEKDLLAVEERWILATSERLIYNTDLTKRDFERLRDPAEIRRKMSESAKRRGPPTKATEAQAIKYKGVPRSEEVKRRISEGIRRNGVKSAVTRTGKPLSEAHKQAVSKALTGKQRKTPVRKPHSEETKQRMREARLRWLANQQVSKPSED